MRSNATPKRAASADSHCISLGPRTAGNDFVAAISMSCFTPPKRLSGAGSTNKRIVDGCAAASRAAISSFVAFGTPSTMTKRFSAKKGITLTSSSKSRTVSPFPSMRTTVSGPYFLTNSSIQRFFSRRNA